MRKLIRLSVLVAAVATVSALGTSAQAASGTRTRQAEFALAAQESGVPLPVLLAVSYGETLWESHDGAPSTTGAYGPMGLVDPPVHGSGKTVATTSGQSLPAAARLIGTSVARVRSDAAANIRAGAALLAADARALNHGDLPSTLGGWYPAVARYSGTTGRDAAARFADDVFRTIHDGAARRTEDGQRLALRAHPSVRPDTSGLAALHLPSTQSSHRAECPPGLPCTYVPAAYASNGSAPTDYGNYDRANRPHKGLRVSYIVIHDTEEAYDATIAGFQNPASATSAHYVVRGSDGTVTQMVPDSDIAWQAGNWYLNMHSIGIEQVGYAIQGATWFTERLYRTTAALVRYLAARYDVPLDRQHIIGHDNVPGTSPNKLPGMHWDPGPFWNWGHFMRLLDARTAPSHAPRGVVRIQPVFAENVQQVTDCQSHRPVAKQPANFVYLRTAPRPDAPLFADPALHPSGDGTTCANDWGDKASAGQEFVVAGRSGNWTAIWWDGTKVWFDNPPAHPVAVAAPALVVRPAPGKSSVPVYGVAYPTAAEFPPAIPAPSDTPLPYRIHSGQAYVYGGVTPTDYYYAKTIDSSIPDDHTNVHGRQRFVEIQLGHRVAFVKRSDVRLSAR